MIEPKTPDISPTLPMNSSTVTPSETVTTNYRRLRKKELKNLMKRDGVWYFHKLVKGQRFFNGRKTPFSLETRDLVLAKAKRDAILKAGDGKEVDRVLGRENQHAAKLAEIFQAYRRSPMVRANASTRERSLAEIERMFRVVKGSDFDVQAADARELTWQLVEAWQAARLKVAMAGCNNDLAALEASKRGINTALRMIQSVFSRKALAAYRSLYLPPNVHDFATAFEIPARKQDTPVQLTDQAVLSLLEAANSLRGIDDAVWVAFQLMTWGGLRNVEVTHARASWLERTVSGYQLTLKPTADFLPKGNSRTVVIPSEVAQAILALQPSARTKAVANAGGVFLDDHLVPGWTKTDRIKACYYRLNQWLAKQGIGSDAGKIAYRLRKYFLKKVAIQQHPLMAQSAGGHSSIATTQDHYIGKPMMTDPIRMPVDLAKLLSFSVTEKPASSTIALGAILDLTQAAQLLEVNAGDLAARSEHAESVTLDGYVLTVRREGGIHGKFVPPPSLA